MITERLLQQAREALSSRGSEEASSFLFGFFLTYTETLELIKELEAIGPGQDPEAVDPRGPLEASDLAKVWDIITRDKDLFVRVSTLRKMLPAGEEVSKDLLAIGYYIAKAESRKDKNINE